MMIHGYGLICRADGVSWHPGPGISVNPPPKIRQNKGSCLSPLWLASIANAAI
jgi:hypothetical protein